MTIIDSILNRFGFVSEKQFQLRVAEAVKFELDRNLPDWLGETADKAKWSIPDPAIFASQADLYRLSPILGTAIDILCSDIGTAKFNVKRMRGEETIDIPNHEFEMKLRNPNPVDSGLEFMIYTTANYKLNGNAIWWMNVAEKGDKPDELWPVPFSSVKPVPDKRLYIDHYDYFPAPQAKPMRLETWEVVHFKTYNPNNRFVGLSPIESLSVTIRGDLAMRKTSTANYSEHNGAPPSILAFKDFVPNNVWEDVKAEKRQAAKRNEMMMLRGVGDGVTWLQRALSNKDMEFVENLRQNMTDVFNRICPGLLAMLSENATEANALAARATYAEKTQWPMMEVIAQKVTSDILPAYGLKLVGIFDDPRVVDRKLRLEEQLAYERSHTMGEVRKEFYQDDPLGDERDDLLPEQIKASSGGIQSEPTPPQSPIQPDAQPGAQPTTEQPPAEEALVEQAQPDMGMKAAIDDLGRWQRKAAKKIGQPVEFDSQFIPESVEKFVRASLKSCKTETALKATFDQARKMIKSAPKTDESEAALILEGLRLALAKNGR